MTSQLRLCGLDQTYQPMRAGYALTDFSSPIGAAQNIHAHVESYFNNPEEFYFHNPSSVASYLVFFVEKAEGILRTIEQGQAVDLQGRIIDKLTQVDELNILSKDLLRIHVAVQRALESPVAQALWLELYVIPMGLSYEAVAFGEKCAECRSLADRLSAGSILVQQRIQAELAPKQEIIDEIMTASVDQTVPVDIVNLVGTYTIE